MRGLICALGWFTSISLVCPNFGWNHLIKAYKIWRENGNNQRM